MSLFIFGSCKLSICLAGLKKNLIATLRAMLLSFFSYCTLLVNFDILFVGLFVCRIIFWFVCHTLYIEFKVFLMLSLSCKALHIRTTLINGKSTSNLTSQTNKEIKSCNLLMSPRYLPKWLKQTTNYSPDGIILHSSSLFPVLEELWEHCYTCPKLVDLPSISPFLDRHSQPQIK